MIEDSGRARTYQQSSALDVENAVMVGIRMFYHHDRYPGFLLTPYTVNEFTPSLLSQNLICHLCMPKACPVNCMHFMSYDELKEMEASRDDGDGRSDHRHFGMGRAHTPLHVSGRSSDANHKSSWYHYLKTKCHGE
jgi:hypothetical protein